MVSDGTFAICHSAKLASSSPRHVAHIIIDGVNRTGLRPTIHDFASLPTPRTRLLLSDSCEDTYPTARRGLVVLIFRRFYTNLNEFFSFFWGAFRVDDMPEGGGRAGYEEWELE